MKKLLTYRLPSDPKVRPCGPFSPPLPGVTKALRKAPVAPVVTQHAMTVPAAHVEIAVRAVG